MSAVDTYRIGFIDGASHADVKCKTLDFWGDNEETR